MDGSTDKLLLLFHFRLALVGLLHCWYHFCLYYITKWLVSSKHHTFIEDMPFNMKGRVFEWVETICEDCNKMIIKMQFFAAVVVIFCRSLCWIDGIFFLLQEIPFLRFFLQKKKYVENYNGLFWILTVILKVLQKKKWKSFSIIDCI